MGKDNTLLLLLAGGAALWFFTQRKDGDNSETRGGMSDAEAMMLMKQEETRQKELEIEYLKEKSERSWEDVAMDFFGGVASKGGEAIGGWFGQVSF